MAGDASFRHGGQLLGGSRVNDAEVAVTLVGGHQQRLCRRFGNSGGVDHKQGQGQDQAERKQHKVHEYLAYSWRKNYIRRTGPLRMRSSEGISCFSRHEPKPSPRPTSSRSPTAWPAAVAVLAVGGLHLSLPEPLTFGPSWLLLAVVAVLLVPV